MFGRKKKTATSVHAYRHLSRRFLHASAFTALPIEPPSAPAKDHVYKKTPLYAIHL